MTTEAKTPIGICDRCGKPESVLMINGRCRECGGFRTCDKCLTGCYESSPTPYWMNRWACDRCGHKTSR